MQAPRGKEEPEGLGEDEEARKTEGIGGVAKEETVTVGEIGGVGDVALDERGEMCGSDWIVEDVLANDEIGRVQKERCVDVRGWPAQPHHPKGQRLCS